MDLNATSLKDIERRTLRYHTADGLYQLMGGAIFAFVGGQGLIVMMVPEGPFRWFFFLLGQCVLPLPVALLALWAVQKCKARMTYPRLGYAQMRFAPLTKLRVAAVLLVAAFGSAAVAGIAFLLIRKQTTPEELALLGALLTGTIWTVFGFVAWVKERDPHHLWAAGAALASGLMAYYLKASRTGVFWVFVSMGVASLVLGTVRLRRFLRENPKAAETEA